MNLFLSHPLNPTDLAWPGEPTLSVEKGHSIDDGEGFNACIFHLANHFGTHYDAPKHFNNSGLKIAELPIEYFVFKKVLVLEIPKGVHGVVEIADLKPHEAEIKKADLLLIRTGYGAAERAKNPTKYVSDGPCIHPDCCKYMVDTFADLRTVGFDFLAVGAPWNDMAGDAHQSMLGVYSSKFITIIEDMKLDELDPKKLKAVYANPLRVVGADSGQVSVIAELDD